MQYLVLLATIVFSLQTFADADLAPGDATSVAGQIVTCGLRPRNGAPPTGTANAGKCAPDRYVYKCSCDYSDGAKFLPYYNKLDRETGSVERVKQLSYNGMPKDECKAFISEQPICQL